MSRMEFGWLVDTTGVDGFRIDAVTTNADGWGNFRCRAGSVSVWLQE